MKKTVTILFLCLVAFGTQAQYFRPDAFPPQEEPLAPKSLTMATTLDEMYQWNRYPTYGVYLEMMNHFVETYPNLCHLDTIGTSVNGRLILSLVIVGTATTDIVRPNFFYSSTIHGDELTGFYFMLRLCDTLLSSYGSSTDITNLLDRVNVYINPLANPDGTYLNDDNTVANSIRYNARMVDLNRNYPNPFGADPLDDIQPETQAMIDYANLHHFVMSANLHGGSEVMNYPWDSFTSSERPHEQSDWWKAVCQRFVDTCRLYNQRAYRSVNREGYIAGGDWYVIYNGRQDYFNYYHNTLELTMEVSNTKKLPTEQLSRYWNFQSHSLINYIKEVLNAPQPSHVEVAPCLPANFRVYPNPTRGKVTIETPEDIRTLDLTNQPSGLYFFRIEGQPVKILKL